MNVGALVFDLDGVIVKTPLVKHAAMVSLFADYPEQLPQISNFIFANGGVPRRDKLAQILRGLQVDPTDALVSEYLSRYAVVLEPQLRKAPMVEGIADFIVGCPAACYVCSSAPEAEVQAQISRCALTSHLAAAYGGTTPKPVALREIAALHTNQTVIFFGDSMSDRDASLEARVAFVGVSCERDNFKDVAIEKITDFSDRRVVEHAMVAAVRERTSALL